VKKGTEQKTVAQSLKRHAAGTKSPKSREKQKDAAPNAEADETLAARLAQIDSGQFLDEAIVLLRETILRQMKENRTAPKTASAASRRARDSNTLSGLVRTLEKLNALDKSREKKISRKMGSDAELKQSFVRRLDQLLTGGEARSIPGDAKRG
jgi:hypothetical protein